MILATADWTLVLAAAVSAVPATLAAVLSALNRREIKTQNGVTLGALVEHTHDLAEEATAKVDQLINGEAEPPHGAPVDEGGNEHGTEAGPENH